MIKRVMQNTALSVAFMKILDTKGILLQKCEISFDLPEYVTNTEEKLKKINLII